MLIKNFPCHIGALNCHFCGSAAPKGLVRYLPWFIFVLLLFTTTPFLKAQSENPESRLVRITWAGGEHAMHYAVEIERSENGNNQHHLYEFTTLLYMDVPLLLGEYRFRIIPYDILGRPADGTEWMYFTVHSARRGLEAEQIQVIDTDDYDPSTGKLRINSLFFNTIGFSVGISSEPKYFIAVHGTYALKPNWFVEIGCDIGLRSRYSKAYQDFWDDQSGTYYSNDIESYSSFYPYANLGYFKPLMKRGGLFIGAGVGCMLAKYTFLYGDDDVRRVLAANLIAGVNLFDFLNISYKFRTDFGSTNTKIALGVVYRFKKEDSDKAGENDAEE